MNVIGKKELKEDGTFSCLSERRAHARLILLFAGLACAPFVFLGGCRTLEVDAGGIGERNQYISGQLDSTIKSLDREIASSNEQVRECLERSRDIESGAERLKYLVERYFEIVRGIQDANDKAVAELRRLEEGMRDAGGDTSCADIGDGHCPLLGADEKD